jgi:hypothetical protein
MPHFSEVIKKYVTTRFFCPRQVFKNIVRSNPGTNPTFVSYNARAVKIYNGASSLAFLKKQKAFFCFGKTL